MPSTSAKQRRLRARIIRWRLRGDPAVSLEANGEEVDAVEVHRDGDEVHLIYEPDTPGYPHWLRIARLQEARHAASAR